MRVVTREAGGYVSSGGERHRDRHSRGVHCPGLGETFYRVKSPETARITGTGLGLSICKQIIAAHHGHLEVESEPGVGSTFRVLLPKREVGG